LQHLLIQVERDLCDRAPIAPPAGWDGAILLTTIPAAMFAKRTAVSIATRRPSPTLERQSRCASPRNVIDLSCYRRACRRESGRNRQFRFSPSVTAINSICKDAAGPGRGKQTIQPGDRFSGSGRKFLQVGQIALPHDNEQNCGSWIDQYRNIKLAPSE